MAQTKIEWATHVWNPVTGCTPVSEGCENCYARRMAYRLRGRFGYPEDNPFRVTLHPGRVSSLEPALRGTGKIIFVCSMGDLFHQDVPESFIREVLKLITATSQHTFLMLTKRPDRMRNVFESYYATGAAIIRNLWLGVTAENQARADERIPILLQIPATVRFVSCEPLLGPVDLRRYMRPLCRGDVRSGHLCRQCYDVYATNDTGIDWVIVGGETGPNARPMHPDWVRKLRDQCVEAGVPFFFKQMYIGGSLVKMPELDGRRYDELPRF